MDTLIYPHCRARKEDRAFTIGALTSSELIAAEEQWIVSAQHSAFPNEFMVLRRSNEVASGQSLALQPFLDTGGLMRVGGRLHQSMEQYSKRHPLIMPSKHRLTKLIIKSEHLRLLHAGPTLVAASLARRFSIVGVRRAIRDVTRSCVIC